MLQRSARRSTAKNAAGTDSSETAKPVCRCDCGGTVYGEEDFGRLWTWCDRCSPVVTIKLR